MECVIKYLSILNILNSLELSKGELSLLSFACVWGDISSKEAKKEFLKLFPLAPRTYDNILYKLLKSGFLVKEESTTLLNKQLHIEFETLLLKIQLSEKA